MPKLEPPLLIQKILEEPNFFERPTDMVSFLSKWAQKLMPNLTEQEAFEQIKENLDEFENLLVREREKIRKQGEIFPYEILLERKQIVGFSFVRLNDSPDLKRLRQIAPLHKKVLEAIRKISPDNFEKFCAHLLKSMGADKSFKTRSSNDRGVDFWGRLPLNSTTLISTDTRTFEEDFKFLVIGQAKAYSPDNSIGPEVIRELIGAIAILKFDPTSFDRLSPQPVEYRLCDPIVPVIMTTGRFTSGAYKMAEKYNVVLRNGAQIATFLSMKGVGIKSNEGGSVFDQRSLDEWLNENRV